MILLDFNFVIGYLHAVYYKALLSFIGVIQERNYFLLHCYRHYYTARMTINYYMASTRISLIFGHQGSTRLTVPCSAMGDLYCCSSGHAFQA